MEKLSKKEMVADLFIKLVNPHNTTDETESILFEIGFLKVHNLTPNQHNIYIKYTRVINND